jgi:hypothetical protein
VATPLVTRTGVTQTLTGIDLSNCGSYAYGPGGTHGDRGRAVRRRRGAWTGD